MNDEQREKRKVAAFELYAEEITELLLEESDQPILSDHIIHEQLVREDPNNAVIASVPIPPGIQRIIMVLQRIEFNMQTLKLCGLKKSRFGKKLELKQEVFHDLVLIWVLEALGELPTLDATLKEKTWEPHVGNDWCMLFVEKLNPPGEKQE
ncbi:MAG: hypothetical protein QG653_442 [Patescibacteria group bacterium]|nr:hypothetical protein [Patescibacteria group bacterium]